MPYDTTYAEADLDRQRVVRNVCGWNVDCGFLQSLILLFIFYIIDVTR